MERVLFVVALALAAGLSALVLMARERWATRQRADRRRPSDARIANDTFRLQLALDAAAEESRRAAADDQARSDFLAAMSHELRTPLNAVLGFAELLRLGQDPMTRRQSQAVDQIARSGRQLLDLVESVLDFAGLAGGRLSLSIERVDPQLIVRQVCEGLSDRAAVAQVTVRTPPPAAGLGVAADPARLRQVLHQLMANAIAYNQPGGEVLVEIRQTPEDAIVAVHDTGVGIPPDRLAEVFQPFNRLGRERSAAPGAGIGLAVAHRLAEAMGGRLEAGSEPGVGSTFTLHLPLARPTTAGMLRAEVPLGGLPAATILYVEDHASNIALMRHVMAALGPIQLHVAETGPDGATLARELRPDVILTDINLPGLSGFGLKAQLDADPLTRGIPVLAVSASARACDAERALSMGFRDYLTKPLDIAALAAALNRALDARDNASEAA